MCGKSPVHESVNEAAVRAGESYVTIPLQLVNIDGWCMFQTQAFCVSLGKAEKRGCGVLQTETTIRGKLPATSYSRAAHLYVSRHVSR